MLGPQVVGVGAGEDQAGDHGTVSSECQPSHSLPSRVIVVMLRSLLPTRSIKREPGSKDSGRVRFISESPGRAF